MKLKIKPWEVSVRLVLSFLGRTLLPGFIEGFLLYFFILIFYLSYFQTCKSQVEIRKKIRKNKVGNLILIRTVFGRSHTWPGLIFLIREAHKKWPAKYTDFFLTFTLRAHYVESVCGPAIGKGGNKIT